MKKEYALFSESSFLKGFLFVFLFGAMLKGFAFQSDPGPIEATGYNEDVVANGVGPMMNSTTDIVDSDSFCFISEDWKENVGDPAITVGLPADGVVTSSDISGLTYQIPSAATPYEVNNSLRIGNTGPSFSGDLTLDTPASYAKLYFLVVSGNGSSDVDVTVNFMDGSTQEFDGLTVTDWYNTGLPVEASGFGRGNRTNDDVETPTGNPKLFRLEIDLDVSNQSKSVESITFTKTNTTDDSVLNVMALSGKEASDCLPPYDITANATSTSEATISWNSVTDNTEWEVAVQPAGTGVPTAAGESTTTATYMVDNLDAGTTYEVYVRGYCSSTSSFSDWQGPVEFTTDCSTVSAFDQGFEGGSLPNCWSINNGGDANTWFIENSSTAHSGNFQARINYTFNAAHDDYLITPPIDISSGTADRLTLFAKNFSTTYVDKFNVVVSTTGNAPADFTETLEANVAPPTNWMEYQYDLSAYDGQTIYIAFQAISLNEYYLFLDDISVDATPACSAPTDLSVDDADITTTSADVTWTESGTATSWEVVYGSPGFDPLNEGTTVDDTDGSAGKTLSGLDPSSTYEVYVRSNCPSGGFSDFAGPVSFSTACGVASTIDEGFESGIPTCWKIINDDTESPFELYTSGTDAHMGSNAVRLKVNYVSHDDYLITPQFSVVANQNDQISFWAKNTGNTDNRKLRFDVVVSTTGNAKADFTDVLATAVQPGETYTKYTYDLSAYDGEDIYVAVRSTYLEAYQFGDYLYVDDFTTSSACPAPSDITFANTDENSTDVSWTSNGSETEWEVVYGEAGFNLDNDEGTTVNVMDDPETNLSDLAANTEYDVYVRAICGTDDESDFVGPEQFTTTTSGCPLITSSFTESFNTEIPACWTVIDNDGQGETWQYYNVDDDSYQPHSGDGATRITYESEAHDDYLISPNFSVISGMTDQVSFYAGGTGTFFAESFDVKLSTTGTAVSDFTETLGSEVNTDDTEFGEYTQYTYSLAPYAGEDVYVAIVATSTDEFYLLVDDFSVNTSASCPEPTNITIDPDAITATTADVSWTAGGGETEWNVIYGEAGFDPDNSGESTTINVMDDPSTMLTNLDPETDYEVYVQAVCGTDDESDLVGPEDFTTSALCSTPPADISVSNTTTTSVDVSFTAAPDAANSEYAVVPYGADADDGAAITGTVATGESIDGLSSGTYYDLYMRTDCGSGTSDYTANPISFVTNFTCGETFVDSGGVNGDFMNDELFSYVIEPETDGNIVTLTFTEVDNTSYDVLTVDTGDGSGPQTVPDISVSGGDDPVEFVSSNSDGTLALEFESSGVVQNPGWEASITCGLPASCQAPTNITIDPDAVTATTADVSWTAGGGETEWNVIYGEAGFDPDNSGESTTINVMDDPNTILTNLDPETDYEVYVQAVCGDDNLSDLSDAASFTTEAAPCEMPTDITVGNITTSTADVSWTPGGSETEWEVAYGPEGFDIVGGGIVLTVMDDPAISLAGLDCGTSYDVYVRAICSGDTSSGWTGPENFSTVCPAPSDITIDNVTEDSADISWTENCSATEWEVIYGEPDFSPETDGQSVIVEDVPETTLSGLDADTEYDVYVRAICGGDSQSDLTGPVPFNTTLGVAGHVFESFTFYPNPVQGELTLKAGQQIEHVGVYNLLGQSVMTSQPNTLQVRLNTEKLQSGVYLMKVTINGSYKTFRVVKK